MLQSIYIQNYALIDTLDISFTPVSLSSPERPAPVNRLVLALSACYWDNGPISKLSRKAPINVL